MLVPKLVTTLKAYDREQFVADLGAGVIVGIVALPLAIAFAIASGVTPGARALHRDHRRLPDLRARRLAGADRRADRRVRRHRLRHRAAATASTG